MIACVSPDFTVRSTPRRISLGPSSVSTETVSPLISSVLMGQFSLLRAGDAGGVLGGSGVCRRRELVLDGRGDLVAQVGERDLTDDVGEEAAHDEALGLVLADAARLQVEQLQVVETPCRRSVPGALDLAGLDLEVRHRVGAGTVGQDEVAVELVGVGALGLGADQHVADPHGVGGLALERALVGGAALAVRRVVVDVRAVLEVLAGVGEVDAEQGRVAARAGVAHVGVDADDLAAERSPRGACSGRRDRRGRRAGPGAGRRRPSAAPTRR